MPCWVFVKNKSCWKCIPPTLEVLSVSPRKSISKPAFRLLAGQLLWKATDRWALTS